MSSNDHEKAPQLGPSLTHTVTSESHRHPPDLAFPYLTQEITSGATNEYRAETAEGYIRADDPDYGLHPIISCSTRVSVATTLARQKTFENKKLVTWVTNDPGNPHNWGTARRWCK
jgi:hypothetical protein